MNYDNEDRLARAVSRWARWRLGSAVVEATREIEEAQFCARGGQLDAEDIHHAPASAIEAFRTGRRWEAGEAYRAQHTEQGRAE